MISFNVPPYVGKEKEYIEQAIEKKKICGDGEFTKSVMNGLKTKQGHQKHYLLHPVHTLQK